MHQSTKDTTIPAGSWVLITGATGFIACHVARQLLKRNYKVRGSVRNLVQASWLIDQLFKSHVDRGEFELVEVPDLGAEGAFDEAVKGVSGIIHLATITSLDPDPRKVIPGTVDGALSVLKAAAEEPSVKEVVYTSSFVALILPWAGDTTHVTQHTWNEAAVEAAWAPPPYEASRSMSTYAASKVTAEKAVWNFVSEKQPHYNVNSINPSGVLGEPLHRKHAEAKSNWLNHIWNNKRSLLDPYPAAYYVDVKDVALLHVAAMLDPAVQKARVQAWGNSAHWNEFLAILRETRPDHAFIEDYPETFHLAVSIDQSEGLSLLKKWAGQEGWRTLRDGIVDSVSNVYF
ncbi:hypothetical protein CMEL01_07810 [Colletotrichum melonis]|uniref:NAD-dependent epimerase/dehydratase domain-containing protein n=1 Tax=Colletotrichum melonis TaxID=1209925 RepID=A0AAI9U4M9_9PEZI|nr:hypothetical protein CMEL01_07810 [Colletotrichum melonis]